MDEKAGEEAGDCDGEGAVVLVDIDCFVAQKLLHFPVLLRQPRLLKRCL